MTSSLVGSEMCIRDSSLPVAFSASPALYLGSPLSSSSFPKMRAASSTKTPPAEPVSYTHLTLPTICSV
eukprot:7773780-Prorocentrum_lima.AAC.1